MPNIFDEYLVNVSDSISKTIPRKLNSPLRCPGSTTEKSSCLPPVTHLEIEDLIANLNSTKSISPHSVSIHILKVLKHYISHPLAGIVNKSFLKGTFLSKLKVANVVSVVKRDDPEITSNIRSISLLPIFSKIFEKLMFKRLYSFVTGYKIIYPLQFGFQANYSIDHALISMTETIRRCLDNKKYGCDVFIDLQKHLLRKL